MMGLSCALLYAGLIAGPIEPAGFGYLDQPAYSIDKHRRPPSNAYLPAAGDIILYSDANLAWKTLYTLAGTGSPGHSGLVVRMIDGELGVLEAGYNDSLWVGIIPLKHRLHEYKGHIWVRQRTSPLTQEQSEALTYFAYASEGRHYSAIRLLLQLTPLRSRGPIRTYFVAHPHGIRNKYICSEAVLEGLVFAGLLEAKTTRPAATYPSDLFFEHSWNRYLRKHLHLATEWEIPALWNRNPVGVSR